MRALACVLFVSTAAVAAVIAAGCAKNESSSSAWTTLKSGLKYRDTQMGTGATASTGTRVSVLYKGWLDNGTVFDASSRHGNEPISFTLGNKEVIAGWDEGIQGMKVGGKRELVVPAAMGYGDEDQGTIPPNSTLHFEVELEGVGS